MGRNSHDAAIFPQDEIGPPFCLKVDDETANDNCVTLRDRDSLKQAWIPVAEIADVIRERLKN